MSAPNALTLELLTWISSRPRTYAEAMETWRSNCPRQPVWDDAVADGLVAVTRGGAVTLTTRGQAFLDGQP